MTGPQHFLNTVSILLNLALVLGLVKAGFPHLLWINGLCAVLLAWLYGYQVGRQR